MTALSIEARIFGSALTMTWIPTGAPKAISVQIATDVNFTANLNHFVLPSATRSATLDVGAGAWFFRVGQWSGKEHEGEITWTPTYGPAVVDCAKPPIQPSASKAVELVNNYPTIGAFRLHTNISERAIVYIEVCKGGTKFEANNTKSRYMLDWGRGSLDVGGLDPHHVYSVRFTTFPVPPAATTATATAAEGRGEFPKSTLVHLPTMCEVLGKRPLRAGRHADGDMMGAARGGQALLRESQERATMRFPSQAAYLRYLATKTGAGYH
jgi:hypothetical protein